MPTLPTDWSWRRAERGDEKRLTALLNACDVHAFGEADTFEDDFRWMWTREGTAIEDDTWVVCDDASEPVGYGVIWNKSPGTEAFFEGWVHPDHRGRGVGAWLLERGEERFSQLAPDGVAIRGYVVTYGNDDAAKALLSSCGYENDRVDWRMTIDVDEPAAEPRPDGFVVERFEWHRDARDVHRVIQESFAEHRNSTRLGWDEWVRAVEAAPRHDPSLWVVAKLDGRIVGAAGNMMLSDELGHVNTLGVLKEARARGIGEALLLRSFAVLRERGARTVTLQVDSGNTTGATRLYERAGMRADRSYAFWWRAFGG